MKLMKRMLAFGLVITTVLCLFSGCGGAGTGTGDKTGEENKNNPSGDKTTTISFGFFAYDEKFYTATIKAFEKEHKDIKIKPVIYENNTDISTQLSALAGAKKLPDVTVGVSSLAYIVQQGWAMPLNEMYEADPDKEYAYKGFLNRFSYDGVIYALPLRLTFNTIWVNKDLLNALNMDAPAYDWNADTFLEMAKKATTSKYSGINYVFNSYLTDSLDTLLMGGLLEAPYQSYGYNLETHTFNFTNGAWAKSQKIVEEMRSYPGLVADTLKNDSLETDDYDKKFGKDTDAMASGKTLFGPHHTSDYGWIHGMGTNYDMYPIPSSDGRIATHVDFAVMMSTVPKEKQAAAYEFLKYVSYGTNGSLERMRYAREDAKKDSGYYMMFIPASNVPEVAKAFNEDKEIPEGIKYMYNTVFEDVNKDLIADCNKFIPDFWTDVSQFRDSAVKKIEQGADPEALAQELEEKVNRATSQTWEKFQKKLDALKK